MQAETSSSQGDPMPLQNYKSPTTDSIHNYGIDALRILSMLLVLTSHILGAGGILEAASPFSGQYEAAWFLQIIAYCSVDCYALISGYVGITAKYKYHNVILLWLRVIYYTISITFLFSVLIPGSVSPKDWIKAILPVTQSYYWYFTSYFALFFFMPLLNAAINNLSKKQLSAVILGLIAIFSCLQTLFYKEIFGTASNAWLLMILYIIGGYIKKYGLFKSYSLVKLSLGYLIMIVFTWLIMLIIESEIFLFTKPLGKNYLLEHTSPTILTASILMVLIFERIYVSQFMQKIIIFFAPTAFSVYLIHAHPFIWNYFLKQKFVRYATFSVPLEILLIFFTSVIIFVLCSFIDLIRIFLFNKFKLKQHLASFEEKHIGNLWC